MAETKKEEKILTSDLPEQQEKLNFRLLALVVLLSFIFGIAGSIFGAQFFNSTPNQQLQDSGEIKTIQVNEQSAVVDVVKRASPAVVSIIVSKDLNKIPGFSTSPFNLDQFFPDSDFQEVGGGSGFVISSDGLIATNKHVVEDENATYTVLMNDGKKYDAEVLSRDPVNDLALVKIQAENLTTLTLGDSSSLQIGQKVIAIGNSLGQYRNTVTTGVVSGIGRTVTASGSASGSELLEGVIQTDAAINPGNSGGPLLDIGGTVIGINTAIDQLGQLVGFALPVNDLKKDWESFKKFGRIVKPFLGVRYVLVNETIKEENELTVDYGALIIGGGKPSEPAVIIGSAADKAGLREGDIILEVNGIRVDSEHSLAGILKDYDPSDVVKMKVLTRGETKEVTVTLGESK
ncbi:MAG: hypothetical protein A3B10_03265 [Candidatus Doudnabacteria bacterium RIFCSPLOWO2_01_FULL_44_21]|uniref:PDZ domain-containing protein n=1 Tax=Candidatus Doudnabacteria bacterium RIFCSPLOWO2_01_FULL_44_21 TaxID=1817841 RepID=A0A1F5PXZ2_9BACT|nr:MAG: hypothetical protein A3B95_02585 [Candidatus Doudnabacteria bacterium RIFCSPHIGHO2_02_FULL_43_13b]OGE94786.1 MAG: hypothetical protein A3B10_03265 [Candidatus Doudnabacteria bacterium RIFCSPLOWO2_01_FULL_44_21]